MYEDKKHVKDLMEDYIGNLYDDMKNPPPHSSIRLIEDPHTQKHHAVVSLLGGILENTFEHAEDYTKNLKWMESFLFEETMKFLPEHEANTTEAQHLLKEIIKEVFEPVQPTKSKVLLTKKQMKSAVQEAKNEAESTDWLVDFFVKKVTRSIKRSKARKRILKPMKKIYDKTSAEFPTYYEEPFDIRCLGYMEVITSSFIRNPFNQFPIVEDPGLDLLWADDPEPIYEHEELYRELCKKYCTPFIKQVEKVLLNQSPILDLKYYPISEKALKALVETLYQNNHIRVLDLTNTWLSSEMAFQLGHLLKLNKTIQVMTLKNCRMSPEIAERFTEGFEGNHTLIELNMDGCHIGDVGFKTLGAILDSHETLRILNLSHNSLTSDSCEALADILQSSMTLETLILGWNNINSNDGLKKMFLAIIENYVRPLVELNMEWNNLPGVIPPEPSTNQRNPPQPGGFWKVVAQMIINQGNIKKLNFNYNFLGEQAIGILCKAIKKSPSLEELRVNGNPLKNVDYEMLLAVIAEKKYSLSLLDITHHYLHKDHKPIVEKARKNDKTVLFTGFFEDFEIIGPNLQKVAVERMKAVANPEKLKAKPKKKKKKKAIKVFGVFLWNVSDGQVLEQNEFINLLNSEGFEKLTADKSLMNSVFKAFKVKPSHVDMEQMRDAFFKSYPETPKPDPPKEPTSKVESKKRGKKTGGKKNIKKTISTKIKKNPASKRKLK